MLFHPLNLPRCPQSVLYAAYVFKRAFFDGKISWFSYLPQRIELKVKIILIFNNFDQLQFRQLFMFGLREQLLKNIQQISQVLSIGAIGMTT
jgi:hypothetical protein